MHNILTKCIPFAPMGETINNPQGILGVLKVPGTPKVKKTIF